LKNGDNYVTVSGWAHGDGEKGTQATKVELSTDGGQTWSEATEYMMNAPKAGKLCYSWTMWKYKCAVPKDSESIKV